MLFRSSFDATIEVTVASKQLLHIFWILAFSRRIAAAVGLRTLSGFKKCLQKPRHHSVSQTLWHSSRSSQSEQWMMLGEEYPMHKRMKSIRCMVRFRMRKAEVPMVRASSSVKSLMSFAMSLRKAGSTHSSMS